MSKVSMSTDQIEALRQCCDAYGADPARWPAARRAALGALYASDAAVDIRAEAQTMDGFLNAATSPRMAEDLPRRVMAGFEAPRDGSVWARLYDQVTDRFSIKRFAPAGALASLGALGFASGMMTASAQNPLMPEDEALTYVQTAIATIDDEGAVQWDVD